MFVRIKREIFNGQFEALSMKLYHTYIIIVRMLLDLHVPLADLATS